jgi:hypothetical protein
VDTFFEVVEFGVETGEVCEVGGGCFDEEGGVPVGLRVRSAGSGCFGVEGFGKVDDHHVVGKINYYNKSGSSSDDHKK